MRSPPLPPTNWPRPIFLSPFALYPVYLRGQADLAAKQGAAALAEFQKILDHSRRSRERADRRSRSSRARARAYALLGDSVKAKTAYQDFFRLWKNADPDVPILKQAKAEFAKLR